MGVQIFVDESKRDGLVVVAAIVLPNDVTRHRKAVRGLLEKNQKRLHMFKESDARRRKILQTFVDLGVSAYLYDARTIRPEHRARTACLYRLIDDSNSLGASRLILETDESLVESDAKTIIGALRRNNQQLDFHHLCAREELLLSIADAYAWAYTRGGNWRSLITHLITHVEVKLP